MKVIKCTCDTCNKDIDTQRSPCFELAYTPSPIATFSSGPSVAHYCSGDCLVIAVETLRDTGRFGGYGHRVKSTRCESCNGNGYIWSGTSGNTLSEVQRNRYRYKGRLMTINTPEICFLVSLAVYVCGLLLFLRFHRK